jgi:hypothetical protein
LEELLALVSDHRGAVELVEPYQEDPVVDDAVVHPRSSWLSRRRTPASARPIGLFP